MSEFKTKVIKNILGVEGKFGNDAQDSGGATNYGITEAVARANSYTGRMEDLPLEFVISIYSTRYWDRLHLDEISKYSKLVAEELMDTGVHQGTVRAALYLQRSLNVLNDRGRIYKDISTDGSIGPATIKALMEFIRYRGYVGEKVLFEMLNSLQGAFYVNLSERRMKDEKFIYGWFKHRVQ